MKQLRSSTSGTLENKADNYLLHNFPVEQTENQLFKKEFCDFKSTSSVFTTQNIEHNIEEARSLYLDSSCSRSEWDWEKSTTPKEKPRLNEKELAQTGKSRLDKIMQHLNYNSNR